MIEPRPRLVPIPAPWRVDHLPHLCLITSEHPDVQPTQLLLHVRALPSTPGDPIEIHIIRLTFEEPYAARLIPGESDMPLDLLMYDTSALPGPVEDWSEWGPINQELEARWRQTGLHPDPGIYQVMPSPWMAELCEDDDRYRHYLVMGRRASVEVIAQGWRWEKVKVVDPPSEPSDADDA